MWDRFARRPIACLCLLVFPALAWPQERGPEQGPPIDLQSALARTVTGNPGLAAFGYTINAAEGRLQQANITPYPELGVAVNDVLGTDDFSGVRSAETTLTIGWVLERGVRQRRIDAARADISLRSLDAEIARIDAAAETARQFLICLAYQGRLRNAQVGVRLAQDTVEAVRARVAASRTLEAELSRAEAELVRAELLEEDYDHELIGAYHRLSAQWGETDPDFGSVSGDVQSFPAIETFETLLARVEQNPELARYMSQQRLAEAELHIAQARSKPDWRYYAGLRRIEATDDFALVGGITIPLGTRDRNLGRVAETRANIARSEAEAVASRVRIETNLFVLYQELFHNVQVAAAMSDNVIPRIESALADTRRAYELGRYSYFEWSVVQSELLEATNDLLEANIDAHRIIIEIERLTGVGFSPATSQ